MRFVGKFVLNFIALLIFCQCDVFAQNPNAKQSPSVVETIKKLQSAATPENISNARNIGFGLLKANDFAQAEIVFAQILDKVPGDGLSLYGKALSSFNLRRYAEAEIAVAAANNLFEKQKNNSALADGLVLSAVVSAVTGDNAAAIKKLKTAIKIMPSHFDAQFSLGRAYFGNGDLENAVTAFRRAAALQPNNVKANFFLATALERKGDSAAALNAYRELIKIAPNVADGYLGLGVLLIKTDGANSPEAISNLQKAVAINENLYEARLNLGKILLQQSKLDEALIHLRKAVELLPNNPEPHYQLLRVYRKLGKKAEVAAEEEIIKKIHENHRGSSSAPR
ncbi:MAG: tetratricopeptide repeat protein [Acidobacteriota bacterium]|nr:tetratricopeptide repeat protein [Acidobacteriota bacterium]